MPDPATYLVLVDRATWPQAIEEMAAHARTRAVAAHALEAARARAQRASP